MSSRSAGWPSFTAGDWRGTHRLILATYADTTAPFLADLAGEGASRQETLAALTDLAALTNGRLRGQLGMAGLSIDPLELVYDVDYAAVVNAAFAYPGQGGRFHDQRRGAWYAALNIETALAEVVHHRAIHLAEIDRWDDTADYRDFMCDVGGEHFADLRGKDRRSVACLAKGSYLAGQALAEQLLASGAAGVVYPSVRHDGTCVVCFRPALLPPISTGGVWRIGWDRPGRPSISEVT